MTLAQLDAEHPVDHDILVADWEREMDQCSKCGRPRALCSDPETTFYPQRTVCYAEMARQQVQWKWDQLHGPDSSEQYHDGSFEVWSPNRSDGTPFAADDGVTLWVATENLTPDDNFLGDDKGGGLDGGEA